MSTTITSRDRLIDILSLSYLGDLLREQLGDDAESYVWPDDFEEAVADIDFKGLIAVGQSSPYDSLICIGRGLDIMPRTSSNGAAQGQWRTVRYVASDLMTEIPDRAFVYQALLTTAPIPNGITRIGSYAFQSCTGLTNVVIPNGVTYVANNAFQYCSALTSIYFPDSVTTIGAGALGGCPNLTSVRLPKVALYPTGNNAIFFGLTGLKTAGPEGTSVDYDIKFGSGTTGISSYLFYQCTGLTTVVIPDDATRIGANAFQSCSALTSISIPNSVTYLGSSAFQGCTNLSSPIIMNGLAIYDAGNANGAFHGCSSLTSFTAPKLTRIAHGTGNVQYGLFYNCSGMTSCTIGSVGYPLTTVPNVAFKGCTNTSLVVTVYTDSNTLATIVANIRNGATKATIIAKAAADMEYNGASYSAGDTVLTSTP